MSKKLARSQHGLEKRGKLERRNLAPLSDGGKVVDLRKEKEQLVLYVGRMGKNGNL